MGRFRRKKHFYKDENGNQQPATNGKAKPKDGFSPREKKRLIQYLEDYRDGARKVMNDCFPKSDDNEKGTPGAAAKSPIIIGGVELPRLTREVLTVPYLKLPCDFSFKQRQFVHDCCVELGIFHCGIGRYKTEERYVAISIYCDVFAEIVGFSRPDYLNLYRSVNPWFCRHEIASVREELTESYRQKVQELIDQPWKCLRDDVDVLNFDELDGEDLSGEPPPGFQEDIDDEGAQLIDTNWVLVDTPEKMRHCIKELQEGNISELAFDLEAYNPSKYSQLTCLLQLASNLGKEYIIDPLAPGVWDAICGLAPIFSDPTIVKVGHSIGGLDVRCLHRDFGIFICNVFDTYEASKVLNLQSQGLAAVCKYYGLAQSTDYSDLKDEYQTTDWRQRPLSKQMILYGRYDVHYLLKLRTLMMRDLTRSELLSDDYAESKLVAESLAATLQRIQAYEDGDEDEFEQFGNGSTYLSLPDEDDAVIDDGDGDGDDDDDDDDYQEGDGSSSFEGGEEHEDEDDEEDLETNEEGFYTPRHSNSFDEFEENGQRNLIANEQDQHVDDDASVQQSNDSIATNIAAAEVLRMQPRLMRVISWSQERCKDLWSGRSEPYYRNPVFVNLMQRAKQQQRKQHKPLEPLSKSQIQLYEDLVRLRAYVAKRDECLPGFVCSLNELALIASERPTNVEALRLINFFLPETIGESSNDSFMRQIFVLTKKSLKYDSVERSPADAAVSRRYGSCKDPRWKSWTDLHGAAQLAMVSAICGAIIVVAVTVVKRKQR